MKSIAQHFKQIHFKYQATSLITYTVKKALLFFIQTVCQL